MRISDWSSDVCSSDLGWTLAEKSTGLSGSTYTETEVYSPLSARELEERLCKYNGTNVSNSRTNANCASTSILPLTNKPNSLRSEERRVGKECVSKCETRVSPSL